MSSALSIDAAEFHVQAGNFHLFMQARFLATAANERGGF